MTFLIQIPTPNAESDPQGSMGTQFLLICLIFLLMWHSLFFYILISFTNVKYKQNCSFNKLMYFFNPRTSSTVNMQCSYFDAIMSTLVGCFAANIIKSSSLLMNHQTTFHNRENGFRIWLLRVDSWQYSLIKKTYEFIKSWTFACILHQ